MKFGLSSAVRSKLVIGAALHITISAAVKAEASFSRLEDWEVEVLEVKEQPIRIMGNDTKR